MRRVTATITLMTGAVLAAGCASGTTYDCPSAAEGPSAEGWSAYRSGDAAAAEAHFSTALHRCPEEPDALVGLGYALLRQDKVEAAASRFRAALEIQPSSVDALAGLGLIAWRRGDLAEVAARFTRVLELAPDHAEARSYLDRLPEGLGRPPERPPLVLPDSVVYPSRVNGEDIEVRTPTGWRAFYIRGVNLGAALPGRHASEFPDSATYVEWIDAMAAMGANAVRVYTIHPPHFYGALAAHNRTEPQSALRLIHGVWTELPPGHDFEDSTWESGFFREMERVVDVIHGRADLPPRPGHASGHYTADVSAWTLAYIIGREWEPFALEAFDSMAAGRIGYGGRYLAVAGGTPSDAWMAKAMEHMVAYEMDTYRAQRPIAYTNWPTLDPLRHPTETTVEEEVAIRRALGETIRKRPLEYDNDAVGLDATLVRPTTRFPAGHFASFHAYPYYPDFIMVEPAYAAARSPYGPSTYFGYLRDLKAHHAGMPVVISEYGVPTGLGYAHLQPQGFHHGGLDEARMAEVNARLTREIRAAGLAGGVVFAWIDEWFKKNWVTIEFELPPDRNRLWYNRLDAEQHYGMFAYEPPPAVPGATAAERRAAWADVAPLAAGSSATMRAAADEAYLWLLVEPARASDGAILGLDLVGSARAGNRRLPRTPGAYPVGFEFALVLDPDTARLLAAPGYNAYRVLPVGQGSPAEARPAPRIQDPPPGFFTGRWEMELGRPLWPAHRADGQYEPLLVIPNRRRFARDSSELPAMGYDRGLLPRGEHPDGLWVRRDDGAFEVRIPWNLLNVTDPSARRVAFERDTTGAIGTTTIDAIRLAGAVRIDGGWRRWPDAGVTRFAWPTWEEPEWRRRERPVYRAMRDVFHEMREP